MNPFIIALCGVTVCGIGGIISILTLLVCVLSWIFIPRWRNIRHFAFLQIILSFNAIYFLPIMLVTRSPFKSHSTSYIGLDITMNFFMFSACCWLMVMAMLFYADLVTVFNSEITRKFLKCSIFGFGIPCLVTIVKVINKLVFFKENKVKNEDDSIYQTVFYYEEIGQNVLLFILLITNFAVYVKVVYSLMTTPTLRRSANHSQKIQVATLAFVMSGVLLMMSVLMTLLMLMGSKDKYYLYPLGLGLYGFQTTVINLCFLMSKANRNIWKQHIESVRRARRLKKQEQDECRSAYNMNRKQNEV